MSGEALIVQATNAIIGVVSAVGMLIYTGIVGAFGLTLLLSLQSLTESIRLGTDRALPFAYVMLCLAVLVVATLIVT